MNNNFSNLNKNTKRKLLESKENLIVQNGQLYSPEGENITHLYDLELYPKKILTHEQLERYRSKRVLGEHEVENGGFIFLFYKSLHNIIELYPSLNKSDIARLMYLTTFISFEDNKIIYENGRIITDDKLSEMLKLKNRQYKSYLNKLVDNEILYIDENNHKYISYNICKYGEINKKQLKKTDIKYIRLFKATVRKLFEETSVRELGRLAIIYMILPYLNLTTNIISHNPDEIETDKIKPMTLSELANVLGYGNYSKLKTALNNVKIDDSYVFGFFQVETDKRTMKIVVNPRVVYAGNGQQLGVIKALFNK